MENAGRFLGIAVAVLIFAALVAFFFWAMSEPPDMPDDRDLQ